MQVFSQLRTFTLLSHDDTKHSLLLCKRNFTNKQHAELHTPEYFGKFCDFKNITSKWSENSHSIRQTLCDFLINANDIFYKNYKSIAKNFTSFSNIKIILNDSHDSNGCCWMNFVFISSVSVFFFFFSTKLKRKQEIAL